MDIKGKRAVVTGAGSGIGRGIAFALARAGADVVIADIEGDKAEAVAREVAETHGVKTGHCRVDVRDPAQVAAMADYAWAELGGVDILCNNAGVVSPAMALDITDADFRWQMEVNVIGVFNGMREFTRRFVQQGTPAWIVNTGSHHSIGSPSKGVAAYVASKHAVLGLADAFRTEHGDMVGFSVLCPGIVRTEVWNAGRNRPAELGGSFLGNERNKEALTSFGMRPERVGELVARGIEAEDFFIFTHPQTISLIEKRYQEGKHAIETQWPDGPDEEHRLTPSDVS